MKQAPQNDTPPDQQTLSDIATKLDVLLTQDHHRMFDEHEEAVLRKLVATWQTAAGIVTVGKYMGLFLAFVVVFTVNFTRIMEILGIWQARP
jgi:hypothetical protein